MGIKYSDIFPTGGNSTSILFSSAINSEGVPIESTGYYYTDNTINHINIYCNSLVETDRILFHNFSNKNVFLGGLSSVDNTTIEQNKGLKILPNNFVEFTVDDGLMNVTKTRGAYAIDWLNGFDPGFKYFRFSYAGNLSEIQYEENNDNIPKRFIAENGATMTNISNFVYEFPSFYALSDGAVSVGNNQYLGSSSGSTNAIFKVAFTTSKVITHLHIAPQGGTGEIYNAPISILVEASNDDITYQQINRIFLGTNQSFVGYLPTPYNGTNLRPLQLVRFAINP